MVDRMKKTTNLALASLALVGGATFYQYYTDYKRQQNCQRALEQAKQYARKQQETVVGSWINMTPEIRQEQAVYLGGITTNAKTYDFIVDAKTAEILLFAEQIRL